MDTNLLQVERDVKEPSKTATKKPKPWLEPKVPYPCQSPLWPNFVRKPEFKAVGNAAKQEYTVVTKADNAEVPAYP